MQIRVVDFEILTINFTKYQEGIQKIENHKQKFLELVEPYRKEMENILMMSQSGIIIDQMTQKQRAEKFQRMQQEVMDLDNDFKVELQKLKSELSSESYSYLESYITEWSVKNDIDIVLGTAEVVFSKPELDITNQILDVLKSKDLYSEYVEESETKI
jgi:Skp family chaperone for outer membrane proteins